jgi:hypothetical protein
MAFKLGTKMRGKRIGSTTFWHQGVKTKIWQTTSIAKFIYLFLKIMHFLKT